MSNDTKKLTEAEQREAGWVSMGQIRFTPPTSDHDTYTAVYTEPTQQSALYEELRAAIDAGSETATHADALAWVKDAHQALASVHGLTLTDDQCEAFRRLPMPFNDMVRAIYAAGVEHRTEPGKST